MGWDPLSVRTGKRPPTGPYEGVPAHLVGPLSAWLEHRFPQVSRIPNRATADSAAVLQIEAANEIALNPGASYYGARGVILRACVTNAELLLDVIDSVLAIGCTSDLITELSGHHDAGKSVWAVADDGTALERWVPPIELVVYEEAIAPADAASNELIEAWNNLNGLRPDPSDAWDHAIKACEHILKPIVTPNQPEATLGNVLGQLRAQQPVVQFDLKDNGVKNQVDPLETLEHVLHFIWPNPDRHGSVSQRAPSRAEAESVVHLAITIVHWCRVGILRAV
jgi:hypothetical protein